MTNIREDIENILNNYSRPHQAEKLEEYLYKMVIQLFQQGADYYNDRI